MIGGAISGYCATGSVGNATEPAMRIRIAITHATIGRRMKKRLNTAHLPRRRRLGAEHRLPPVRLLRSRARLRWWRAGLRTFLELLQRRLRRDPGARALQAVDDNAIGGGEALEDDAHGPVERADLDAPHLDDVLVVQHIGE